MDYFLWNEKRGNFDKLFIQPFENSEFYNNTNITRQNVVATYNESILSNFSYTLTNKTFDYLCAYDSLDLDQKNNYCYLYNQICSKDSKNTTTNCHCRNKKKIHFCEYSCNNSSIQNETTCGNCESIFTVYKSPKINLYFNFITKSITMQIESYLKLIPVNNNIIVYCFTDAKHTEHDVTYRYENTNTRTVLKEYKTIIFELDPIEKSLGHYWCIGFPFDINGKIKELKSNIIIAEKKNYKESFTLNVTVFEEKRTYPLIIHEETLENISKIINESNPELIQQINFLKLYKRNEKKSTVKIGYRLYFDNTNQTMQEVLTEISTIFNQTDNSTIQSFNVRPSYCLKSTTYNNNMNLTWEDTLLGATTIPNELCLKNDSKPVTRKCIGEYLYGTYWEEVKGTCVNNSGILFGSPNTVELHNISRNNDDPYNNLQKVNNILHNEHNKITIDAHFVAKIFESVTLCQNLTFENLTFVVEVASNIMELSRNVLKDAQNFLNSTDIILYSLDKIFGRYNLTDGNGYQHITSKNINVQISHNATITGAAFYEENGNVRIEPIRLPNELDLTDTNLKLVAYLTNKTIKKIKKDSQLVITAFRQDALFNNEENVTTTGYSTSIHLSQNGEQYWTDEPIIKIRPTRKYRAELRCDYWNYGRDQLWFNQKGKWEHPKTDPCPLNELCPCLFRVKNPLGILVGNEDDIILSIVTVVGCTLSALGSLAVIVTAIVYKQWREKSGTKILVNFVLTNLLQNVTLGVSSGIDSYKEIITCEIVGATLHYAICSQFTWMLVIGYLQYLRYVEVFYVVHDTFVIKSSIVAWILPIVPVITVLQLNEQWYLQDNFCYLHDKPLLYGIYIPVSFTLGVNFIIFVTIITNITCYRKNDPNRLRDNISWLNLRLVILLFFLLGLYWVFGVAARFTQFIALDYFFCISASLQGLIVFLYFIVFNKMTRNFWLKQLRRAEMITTMQLWLQQRKKIGKVRLDNGRTKSVKIRIMESLAASKKRED